MLDSMTQQKMQLELWEDYDARSYGYDRYHTESMYDYMDRIDSSLKMLVERRVSQNRRIAQRESSADARWRNNVWTKTDPSNTPLVY